MGNTLNGNRPNVSQIVYDSYTEIVTVYIGSDPDPFLSTGTVEIIALKTQSEFNYYFNALKDNIGAENVNITHVETSGQPSYLQYILIGKGASGSGIPGVPPPPVFNIINNVKVGIVPIEYLLTFNWSDFDEIVEYRTSIGALAQGQMTTAPRLDINQMVVHATSNDDYPVTITITWYNKGEIVKQEINQDGKGTIISFDGLQFDTIVFDNATASDTLLQWDYKRTTAATGNLTITKDLIINAQTFEGAINQSGAFDIAAGDAIDILASSSGTANLIVMNVTDNIVMYNSNNSDTAHFAFVAAANKAYSVALVAVRLN
jgi:hypothetical protein